MGFVTNAQLTMAHRPPIFKAFVELAAATFKEYGNVTPGLKALVGNIASKTAGCSYYMSHTASNAMRPGYDTDEAKVAVVWNIRPTRYFPTRNVQHWNSPSVRRRSRTS
jgi:alkylhydroperoxidase family enzyme